MKTRTQAALSFLLICSFLAACGPAQLEAATTQTIADNFIQQTASAPTAAATLTPRPTVTDTPAPSPKPTVTPTSPPTFTPTPTKNPLAGEFKDGKLVMTNEAFNILTDIAQGWQDKGLYLAEIVTYKAMLDYSLQPDQLAFILNMRANDYEMLGHYDLAIEDLLQSLNLGVRKPVTLNNLCWDYTITGNAQEALPYCEEAVKQDPSCANLDSRGVAYALMGKYAEAATDLEAALALDEYPSKEMKTERQQWVPALKAGQNPITAQVLEQQRSEESALTIDPQYTGDLKLSYVRQQLEDKGYTFEANSLDGQEGVMGTLKDGECTSEIVLLGNEQEFTGGTSTTLGCSHNDLSGHAWEFTYAFAKDLEEMGRALVWQSADYYYVIEGKTVTDTSPTIGGFQFTVEQVSRDGKDGILVTAKTAE